MVRSERARGVGARNLGVDGFLGLAGEDEGIVGHGAKFGRDDPADMINRIHRGAEHLGDRAQRVGILHAGIVLLVGGDDLGAFEQAEDGAGGAHLAGLAADLVEAVVEESVRGAAGVERHGGRAMGGAGEMIDIGEHEGADGAHHVGAVDEGEPFLRLQFDRGEVCAGQRVRPRKVLTLICRFAFAEQDEGGVGEGREVARGADGPPGGDDGRDAGVQQVEDALNEVGPGAGMAPAEAGGLDEHHRANDIVGQRFADAGGVGADEVVLDIAELFGVDADAGEGAEAGVDAVDRLFAGGVLINDGAGAVDAADGVVAECDGAMVAGDVGDFFDGERSAGEDERLDGHDSIPGCPIFARGVDARDAGTLSGGRGPGAGGQLHCRLESLHAHKNARRGDGGRICIHGSILSAPVSPRAARHRVITCKTWQAEAAMRMLMNNLDPEVAEKPATRRLRRAGPGGAVVGGVRRDHRIAEEAGAG
jgi:hypothetical protein